MFCFGSLMSHAFLIYIQNNELSNRLTLTHTIKSTSDAYLAVQTVLSVDLQFRLTLFIFDISFLCFESIHKRGWISCSGKLIYSSNCIWTKREKGKLLLVDTGWAVTWLWCSILWKVYLLWDLGIPQAQMRWLIMIMIGITPVIIIIQVATAHKYHRKSTFTLL